MTPPLSRASALSVAAALAACAPQPMPADPATIAANAREQAKLAALAECHLEAGGVGALVDLCMERRGYWRASSESPVAAAGLGG